MISSILLIVATVLLISGAISGVVTFSWLREARVVPGTVVELIEVSSSSTNSSDYTYAPRVQYIIDDVEREFVSSQSSSPAQFNVGESVKVASNLKRGHECIATFGELYGFPLIAGLLGFSMLVAILCYLKGDKLLRLLHPNLG